MIRYKKLGVLKRKIRQDDMADLAIPTWTLVREAVQAGEVDKALEFMEYGLAEAKIMHDSLVSFTDAVLTHLAGFGEEEIYKAVRSQFYNIVKNWLSTAPSVEETVKRYSELQRGHFSEFTVVEEPDRYVVRYDPCGSGGRLRRTKNVGATKKAYPWSWGRSGVPYYCVHCCIGWEIIATELQGYPVRINLPGEKPEDPCVHLFYKRPELIPGEYFTRIGKTKTVK